MALVVLVPGLVPPLVHPAAHRLSPPPSRRLSTVQDAHRIVVIQHGQVAEQGTHDELLEAGGVYASLVRRQLARAPSSGSLLRSTSSASILR